MQSMHCEAGEIILKSTCPGFTSASHFSFQLVNFLHLNISCWTGNATSNISYACQEMNLADLIQTQSFNLERST